MKYGRKARRYRYPDKYHRDMMILRASPWRTENWTGTYHMFRKATKRRLEPMWQAMRVLYETEPIGSIRVQYVHVGRRPPLPYRFDEDT